MKIKFSDQGTGACPLCSKYERCEILKNAEISFLRNVKEENDEVMEVVIYRCPEFVEAGKLDKTNPFT